MTKDVVDAQIATHEAAIAYHRAEIETLRTRTRSPVLASATSPARKRAVPRYELAQSAFYRRYPGFAEHTVRRLCAANPQFARRLTAGGAWHVIVDEFENFCDLVDSNERQFATSAMFAVSVAPAEQIAISFGQQSMRESEDAR